MTSYNQQKKEARLIKAALLKKRKQNLKYSFFRSPSKSNNVL